MKKILFFISFFLLLIGSCGKTCKNNNTGNITIYDVSPDWIIETTANIEWADGTKTSIIINKEDTFYNKPVGETTIEMTYKSDSCYYYSSNFTIIYKCNHVPVFCTFQKN